ncbi:MAG: HAD family hydrolase [Thaumarchaeota archaeon]|nr:HAD family hydrolase [Nitrososphaerota archaeon]MCL5319145.1 HAD family hydrolase [Nitrososphaerota archaeon]
MLRAVILDFDGTLNTSKRYYARFDQLALEILAERFSCTEAEADRKITEVKRKSLSLTKALLSLNIDSDEFYRQVAEQMDMASLLDEDIRIEPLISALRNRNLQIALLTNSGRFLIDKVLATIKCPSEIFDAVITSSEVDPKPSLQPFRYTAEQLGCKPSETLYVGDRVYHELKPAKLVGMKTVLIGSVSKPEETQWVDWQLETVHKLPELIATTPSLT